MCQRPTLKHSPRNLHIYHHLPLVNVRICWNVIAICIKRYQVASAVAMKLGSIWILELGQGIALVRILFEEGPCKLCTLGVGCLAMCIMCSEFEASERSERSERACHVFQRTFMYIQYHSMSQRVTTCFTFLGASSAPEVKLLLTHAVKAKSQSMSAVYFMMVYDCAAAKASVLISLKVIWGILGQLKYLWPESERCFSPSSLSSLQITGSEVLRE